MGCTIVLIKDCSIRGNIPNHRCVQGLRGQVVQGDMLCCVRSRRNSFQSVFFGFRV